ncbi:PKD domain-containing protein [Rhodospirillaceae bacterium SYSU D60014]|uniref:PKD domain-containing protein n=1 Tax=Virgifigura deserti TaxID=2268457 RepID=UPI000E66E90A
MQPNVSGTRIGYLFLAAVLSGWTMAAAAAEEPLSVTYGEAALTTEGDPEFREIIYFRVPQSTTGRLYLRVFDAEVGGAHDLRYGTGWDTGMRYVVYGGKGAATLPDSPLARRRDAGTVEPGMESEEATSHGLGGTILADLTIGEEAAHDDIWQTLANFMPEQGDPIDGQYVFRLEVVGHSGDDANLFMATLSLRDRRNATPSSLETLSFAPTIRIPDRSRLTELAFEIPADAERIIVHNFDAAYGRVAFAGTYRTIELAASGQDEWQQSEITLLPEEQGTDGSITVAGGEESPNDLTLFVTDSAGHPLPMRLQAESWSPNGRPQPVADSTLLADCSAFAFDAARSSDPDGDQLSYLWDFGDGASGVGIAVVHRYQEPGSYNGALRVLDDSGQIGSGAMQPFRVVAKRPPRADAGPDIVVAPGEPVNFDGTGSTPGDRPISRYSWNFQDGTEDSGPKTAHAFTNSGRYAVTLLVQDDQPGACNSSTDQIIVDVNVPPVAVAGLDRRASVGETVELDGRPSYDIDGQVTGWSWDLGDGTTAEGPTVAHRYERPGTYAVTLTVRDAAGLANSTATNSARIIVNDPPVAAAGPDRKVAVGEIIAFDGRGSLDHDGKLVHYAWDFGDKSEGVGAEVPYAYDRPGTYEAALVVTDDSATSTNTSSDTAIIVVNAPPIARAGDDQIVTSSEVRFDATASEDPDGKIARYAWDFGDGATGEGARTAHVYRKAGHYRVSLTVTDDSGTSRSSATDTLLLLVNEAPIADAGKDQLGAPGQELTFLGSGSLDPDGDVADYFWDFKDGSTATGEQVAHRFTRPGIYQVQLSVRDNTGQPDAVDFDEAEVVINAPPVANAGADIFATPGDEVVLDAGNAFDPDGSIVSYRWDFNDIAEPATGRTVSRVYASPGIYSARLTVTDGSGASNGVAQDEVVIRINHAPVAHPGEDIFTSSSTITVDGGASTDADGDALVYSWDFGDGSPLAGGVKATHTYVTGGTYPVVLTVDDGTGLGNAKTQAAITVTVDRPPVADAGGNREVCAGDVVVFDGSNSRDPEDGLLRYHWDFGDGSDADIVNPTKTYHHGAAYPVTLTVEDDSGFPANRHTERVLVRVNESPIADAGPDQRVCAGTEVHFDGSGSRDSDGVVNRFTWNFGDGAAGGGDRPVHIFGKPGDYRVVLTIEGDQVGQCANTNSNEMIVRVVEAPIPRILAPAGIAVGDAAAFDASSSTTTSGRIVAWEWDFGDGSSAEGPSVRHAYEKSGSFVVTLTLRTEGSVGTCSVVTAQHAIVVNAPPVADAGGDRTVGMEEILFDASKSHDPDGGIVAYSWDFGDGTTASGVNARHSFRRSGRYEVTLTVTDNTNLSNNKATDTIIAVANQAPMPVITAPKAACPGDEIALGAGTSLDPDGRIVDFDWSFGDGQTAQGQDVSHVYQASGLYELVLTVDDGAGLNNSRQHSVVRVRVNQPPHAEAGPNRFVCPDQEVTFDGSASVDWDDRLVEYRWDFGDGTGADGMNATHSFTKAGVYDVRLTVTDDSGSSCAADTDVARIIVNTPPVAQAGHDREGFVGGAHDELMFDASGSQDADGHPLSFLWDLGDGVVLAGDKVRHSYAEPGTYPVRLTVSDGSGLSCGKSSDTVEVNARRRE